MATSTFKTTDNLIITKTLSDGEIDLFPAARIYDPSMDEVSTDWIPLTSVAFGLYSSAPVTGITLIEGNYTILLAVFDEASLTNLNEKYGIMEDKYWITNFEQTILDEVPDNILLDDDARLDNLNTIPDLATTADLTNESNDIKNSINDNIDSSEGRIA